MINENLKKQLPTKDSVFELISDIGFDYDGCKTVKGLKSIIDELCELANYGATIENNTTDIAKLKEEILRLQLERDAAVIDLTDVCLNQIGVDKCRSCKFNERCEKWTCEAERCEKWEWRGVNNENTVVRCAHCIHGRPTKMREGIFCKVWNDFRLKDNFCSEGEIDKGDKICK